jgi:hypothetical protein
VPKSLRIAGGIRTIAQHPKGDEMLHLISNDTSNVVPFPEKKAERLTIAMVAVLSPPRSLVDSFMADRGLPFPDVHAETGRDIAFQARTLQASVGGDETVIRLRVLVDAHIVHAVHLCRNYRLAGDRLMAIEQEATQAIRHSPELEMRLTAAREQLRSSVIAARVAAEAAFGAVTAFSTYVLKSLAGLPMSKVDPRQLSLFAAAG